MKDSYSNSRRGMRSIDRVWGWLCGRFAERLIRQPRLGVVLSLVAAVLVIAGGALCITLWHTESSISSFLDPESPVVLEAKKNEQLFGENPRYETVIIRPGAPSVNLLSQDILATIYDVVDTLQQRPSPDTNSTFKDVCFDMYNDGFCSIMSVTELWEDKAALLQDPHPTQTMACSPCFNPDTMHAIVPQYILGKGYQRNQTDITHVEAYVVTFLVRPDGAAYSPGGGAVADWEKAFVAIIEEAAAQYPHLEFFVGTEGGLVRTVTAEAVADIPVIVGSYVAMTVYLAFVLRCWKRWTRVWLLCTTFFSSFGALLLGVGIGFLVNLPLNPLVLQGLPFLVLALAVDAVCQLISHVERPLVDTRSEGDVEAGAYPSDLSTRLASTFSVVGATIPFAAVVETSVFAIGCVVPDPAIRSLCAYAAICTATNAIMQVLLVLPAVVKDTQKQMEASNAALNEPNPAINAAVNTVSEKTNLLQQGKKHNDGPCSLNGWRRKHGGYVCSKPWHVAALIALSSLLGALVVLDIVALQPGVPVHFDQGDLVSSTSSIAKFLHAQSDYLGIGPPVYLGVNGLPAGTHQETVAALPKALRNSPRVATNVGVFDWYGDVAWWWTTCRGESALPQNDTAFAAVVSDYLTLDCDSLCSGCPLIGGDNQQCPPSLPANTPGCQFPWGICLGAACQIREIHRANVKLTKKESTEGPAEVALSTYRFQAYLTALGSFEEFINGYHAVLDLVSGIQPVDPPADAFATSVFMPFYTQYDHIWSWTCLSLGLAAGVTLVVVSLWSGQLILGGASMLFLVLPIVTCFSSFAFASGLNTSTLVNTVLSTGLCLETFLHSLKQIIVHKRQAKEAVRTIMLGMWATKVLGAAMLVFAQSRLTSVYFLQPVLVVLGVSGLEWMLFLAVESFCRRWKASKQPGTKPL